MLKGEWALPIQTLYVPLAALFSAAALFWFRRAPEHRRKLPYHAPGVVSWDHDLIRLNTALSENAAMFFNRPDVFTIDTQTWNSLIHPDDRELFSKAIHSADANEVFQFEFRFSWPDGSWRWLQSNGQVVRGKDGRPVRMFGMTIDISDRKNIENQLNEKTEQLARSNAELEKFAYLASHDLKEPLRVVSIYVELLREQYRGKLDSDADEFIEYATEGTIRMGKLIDALLYYSRVGMDRVRLGTVNCDAMIQKVLASLRHSFNPALIHIEVGPLPVVRADEVLLPQIFQNLVGNALKFAGSENPCISISAEVTDNEWRFKVKDNGIGIDPEYHDQIFIMFRRLHSRDRYDGAGIGLAVCKKIVEMHGGRIWVESQVGQGSTFCFALPIQ